MIHIIITAYGEPKSTAKAIQAFLDQNINEDFKIIIADPFPETQTFLKKEFPKNNKLEFFLDPGEGKSYALNVLLEQIYSKNSDDIIILTDGDVFVSKNSVKAILEAFKDKKVGCVTGKPVSLNQRNTKYGYWASLLFDGIDKVRSELSKNKQFFECSGYLFAIRNGVLQGFPLETAEDSIIPFLFWQKGYKIKYTRQAQVYVMSPKNWKDWKTQKIRNIKAHENLNKIVKDMPRTKSLSSEITRGTFFALAYPRSVKEFFWTLELFGARLWIYIRAFYDLKLKKKVFVDGWRVEKTESTSMED